MFHTKPTIATYLQLLQSELDSSEHYITYGMHDNRFYTVVATQTNHSQTRYRIFVYDFKKTTELVAEFHTDISAHSLYITPRIFNFFPPKAIEAVFARIIQSALPQEHIFLISASFHPAEMARYKLEQLLFSMKIPFDLGLQTNFTIVLPRARQDYFDYVSVNQRRENTIVTYLQEVLTGLLKNKNQVQLLNHGPFEEGRYHILKTTTQMDKAAEVYQLYCGTDLKAEIAVFNRANHRYLQDLSIPFRASEELLCLLLQQVAIEVINAGPAEISGLVTLNKGQKKKVIVGLAAAGFHVGKGDERVAISLRREDLQHVDTL